MIKIPVLNIKRALELKEIEKQRELTEEEFNSCMSYRFITEEEWDKIKQHFIKSLEENGNN